MTHKPAPSLKAAALRMLATREHSRAELRRKLAAKAEAGDDIEAVLDCMAATGLQSDARFAESFVRSKGNRFGAARLKRELAERGVNDELVAVAFDEALEGDELARARTVWSRKFGEVPQDSKEWSRQARFLQSRGFAVGIIRKLLKEPFDESA